MPLSAPEIAFAPADGAPGDYSPEGEAVVVPVPITDGLFTRAAEESRLIGSTGLRQVDELVHERRATAGEREVPGSPKVAYEQLYGTAGVGMVST